MRKSVHQFRGFSRFTLCSLLFGAFISHVFTKRLESGTRVDLPFAGVQLGLDAIDLLV